MGAEVIKIEGPQTPDMGRQWPPFAEDKPEGLNRSGFFALFHGNEKDCLLDLKTPEGLDAIKSLIRISDVVIDNFAPRVMPNLGLDYESLKDVKPDIIMISLSGYGANGPDRNRAAFAQVLGTYAGESMITGHPGGQRAVGVGSDQIAGLTGAFTVLAALHYRDLTGEGQFIDLAEVESLLATNPEAIMEYVMTGRLPTAQGNRDYVHAPQGCYRCQGEDRWVAISVGSDSEWQDLCRVMGKPELIDDERFRDTFSRLHHQDELDNLISEWTTGQNSVDAMTRLQQSGVAATHVNDGRDVYYDPHLKARECFVEIEHPEVGRRKVVGVFAKLSATPGIIGRDPLFGEHTDWLLNELLPADDNE
jgi:benzylsuccinate CoA-transferase BbsF subunit